jgi:DUF971 family protein
MVVISVGVSCSIPKRWRTEIPMKALIYDFAAYKMCEVQKQGIYAVRQSFYSVRESGIHI